MTGYKKIAIVYDWMDKWGGVERVLLTLNEMFPKATFFTSYYNPKKAYWAKHLNINQSFIGKIPKFIKDSRIFSVILYPLAFESFNFNDFDLVISVTSSYAKSIITSPNTKHICYLLTPTRFLWSHQDDYLKKYVQYANFYIKYLKNWDLIAAQRPDKIISISETVSRRCEKYYGRKNDVVYPPFDLEYWENIRHRILTKKFKENKGSQLDPNSNIFSSKFYLIVSRLEPYKKIDLAISLFKKFKKKLLIVGEGTQRNYLRSISDDNIHFFSKLTDLELGFLYSKAEALLMPQEEDFGYVSLEAQFFGCPVIAFGKGGAVETVIEDKTGILFNNQSVGDLRQAVERFEKIKYNLKLNMPKLVPSNLKRFSKMDFIKNFLNCIE